MIGATLRTLRRARGLSQQALAERAGVTQHHLCHIESGRNLPRLDTIVRIADALDCDATLTITPRT
jgi:transcriptional regulator with XRE-family HTH domain